jgi:hypothetical protein
MGGVLRHQRHGASSLNAEKRSHAITWRCAFVAELLLSDGHAVNVNCW